MGLLVSKFFIERKITNDICAICLEKLLIHKNKYVVMVFVKNVLI